MRLAFWILLLGNLLLFLWGQGHFAAKNAGREPERLQRQVDPDKLRIVPAGSAHAARAAAEVARPACKRIEWLAAAELAAVREAVAALPGWKAGQETPRKEASTHWVMIPELSSRALAERKKGELDKLGIKDGEIVEDAAQGPYAVSLGVFRSQQLAEEFFQTLTKKGVRSARLVQRSQPPEKFAIELHAPSDELNRRLPELIPPQAQVRLVECAAP